MPDERLSMAEQLSATYDKLEKETPEPVEREPAAEYTAEEPAPHEPTAAERARDESGRFTEKPKDKARETLTLKEKPNAAKEQERPAEAKPSDKDAGAGLRADGAGDKAAVKPGDNANAQGAPIQPPANWPGQSKIEFARLPYHVKQELAANFATIAPLQAMAPVIAPYEQRFQQEFGGTDRALGTILSAWEFARKQPVDFVKSFIQQFNLDPQALGFASGAPSQQQVEPGAPQYVTREDLAAIQQQQAAETRRLNAEAEAQSFQRTIMSDIAAMQADAATFPYFNDVRSHMVGLIQSPGMSELIKEKGGKAALKEAYDQAVWANKTTRDALVQTQQREAATKLATERKAQADKARMAGGSITGSPGVARGDVHVNQSVRADLAKNWDAMEARV